MNDTTHFNETTPKGRRPLIPSAQRDFKRGGRKRLLGAVLAALVGLVLLIVLGPSQEEIQKRFEYYGAPGELKIMPEISIEEGHSQVAQLPKTLQTPPPPSRIEVEPEPEDDKAEDPKPKDAPLEDLQPVDRPSLDPNPDAETLDRNQVELAMPMQTNPDWFILRQVLPEYPFDASEAEQRIPVIQVRAAIFVDAEGNVSEAMIQATNGSAIFSTEVLRAIRQWKFGWRVDPKAGRWIEMTFNFNSPYGLPSAG